MKIQTSSDQMVIENSLAMAIIGCIILVLVGVAVGALGFLNHLWWMPVLGVVLLIVAGLIIVFAKSSRIVLAKSGESSIAAKTLFGAAQSKMFALAEVQAVQLVYSVTQRRRSASDGSSQVDTQAKSIVYLMMAGGGIMQIGSATRSVNTGMLGALIQSAPLKKEAEAIANFIGVPLRTSDSMTFGQHAAGIR